MPPLEGHRRPQGAFRADLPTAPSILQESGMRGVPVQSRKLLSHHLHGCRQLTVRRFRETRDDSLAQFLPWLEVQAIFIWHVNLITRSRIAGYTGWSVIDSKASKASDFNAVTLR